MSREIKFRIWDKANKEYMRLGATGLDARNGDVIDYYNEGDRLGGPDEYDVEQCTGLKDKNGKEIYEGDIVKCYSQDTYPVGRVMYSEEWCAYEIVSYDPEDCRVYNLESFSPTVNKYLEIIGNIHENKELLGGEE